MSFSPAFFEVSAQLIPVLFLAMVVEERLQGSSDEVAVDRILKTWAAALLVSSEILSLSVVAGGLSPTRGPGLLVAGALILAAMLIIGSVVDRATHESSSLGEKRGHLAAGMFALLVLLATIAAIWL